MFTTGAILFSFYLEPEFPQNAWFVPEVTQSIAIAGCRAIPFPFLSYPEFQILMLFYDYEPLYALFLSCRVCSVFCLRSGKEVAVEFTNTRAVLVMNVI